MENAKWVYDVNVFGLMETTLVSVGGVGFFFFFCYSDLFFFLFLFFCLFYYYYYYYLFFAAKSLSPSSEATRSQPHPPF